MSSFSSLDVASNISNRTRLRAKLEGFGGLRHLRVNQPASQESESSVSLGAMRDESASILIANDLVSA